MLGHRASRVISSFLRTRTHYGASSSVLSALKDQSQPEPAQLRSLSTWFVDSLRAQSMNFSTSQLRREKEGTETRPEKPEAQEDAAASGADTEQAEPGDPYTSLTREQMHDALLGKDEALAQGGEQNEELTGMLKRTLADMENLRQRTAKQADSAQKFAIQGFLKSLLDVGDNLERAYGAVPPEALEGRDADGSSLTPEKAVSLLNSIVNGVKLTDKIFNQALEQNGVKKFRPEGEKFDPNLHDALFELPDPSKEPGTVGAVTKSGYSLHGRVVRPAQVGVVRAPS